jgi:zinc protease
MTEEGHLFMPGLLNRDEVSAARRTCAEKLARANLLDPDHDIMECVAVKDADVTFMPELARGNPELMKALYDGPMIAFFEKLLGGEVLHFDYTWFRAVAPGRGTPPHMDVVYRLSPIQSDTSASLSRVQAAIQQIRAGCGQGQGNFLMKSFDRKQPIAFAGVLALMLMLTSCALPPAPPSRPAQPGAPAATTTELALTDPLPIDPQVRVGKLDNGLTYYVRANKEPRQRAEFWLVVNAGSVLEDDDQKGLAHFVEHMLFNGTQRFEGQELINFLESLGIEFGPDVNAYTSFDETVYQLQVPTDKPELVETGLDVLKDWAGAATLAPTEVDAERGVIVEEWRLRGQTASGRITEKIVPLLLEGSQYAGRLPIGDMDIVRNAPPETLRRYYETWYRPDLMAVVAVGDFDSDHVESLIKERFSDLPAPANPKTRPALDVPKHGETRYLIATDRENPYAELEIIHRVDKRPYTTVGDYRQFLVDWLVSSMLTNRFEELRQQPNAPFIFAAAGSGELVRPAGIFDVSAQTKDTDIAAGLDALLTEIERVRQFGFTEGELAQAKAEAMRAYERYYADRNNLRNTSFADEYTAHFLSGVPMPGVENEFNYAQQLMPGITLDDVNRRSETLMPEGDRAILLTAPEKSGLKVPAEADLAAVVDGVKTKQIEPYVARAVATEVMAANDKPAPVAIVEERTLPELGITEMELANGVRVLMKPTDFVKSEIVFQGVSPGGASLAPDADYPEAANASNIVRQSGIGQLSQPELDKLLARKVASVAPFIGELREGFSGSAAPEDLELALQLVYLYATQPRFDETAFDVFKQQQRAFLSNRSLNPDTTRFDAIAAALCGASIRCNVLPLSEIESIDLKRVEQIYRGRFGDLGDATFLFTGNFDVENLKSLARIYLGNLPSSGRKENWQDVIPDRAQQPVEKTVYKGEGDRSVVDIIYDGPADLDFEDRIRLNALEKLLDIRLREELREARGGTYSPSARSRWIEEPDPTYRLSMEFSADPKRAEELTKVAIEVLEDIKKNGTSDVNLVKIKEQMLRAREVDVRNNRYWLDVLDETSKDTARGLDTLKFNDVVSALTVQDIQQAAQQFLKDDNIVRITQYPDGFK